MDLPSEGGIFPWWFKEKDKTKLSSKNPDFQDQSQCLKNQLIRTKMTMTEKNEIIFVIDCIVDGKRCEILMRQDDVLKKVYHMKELELATGKKQKIFIPESLDLQKVKDLPIRPRLEYIKKNITFEQIGALVGSTGNAVV